MTGQNIKKPIINYKILLHLCLLYHNRPTDGQNIHRIDTH